MATDGGRVVGIAGFDTPCVVLRCSLAGLAIHPAVEARERIDRKSIPDDRSARLGDISDLNLVASVDAALRGSRAEDVEYLLGVGAMMQVIDRGAARGYVVHRHKRLLTLGATDDTTASVLLWRFLAEAETEAEIWGMTARQNWAVKVVLAARLEVVPFGALCLAGRDHPPGPWLPSGWYF